MTQRRAFVVEKQKNKTKQKTIAPLEDVLRFLRRVKHSWKYLKVLLQCYSTAVGSLNWAEVRTYNGFYRADAPPPVSVIPFCFFFFYNIDICEKCCISRR